MTTTNPLPTHDTADAIVAQRIIERLIATNLMPQTLDDDAWVLLIEGGTKEADWRLLAQNILTIQDESA